MGRWERALDAAGVEQASLRSDYGRVRAQASAFKHEIVLAAELLLPERLVAHVIAAIAFMHRTDVLLDSGPAAERKESYEDWEREVTEALEANQSGDPELRPLLHTIVAHPVLHERVLDYLASADLDLEFTGFVAEADYQTYVEGYSLPAFMLVATLLGPDGDQQAYRAACRTYIEAIQRLDFVNDLAEDLANDRLTIPAQTLEQHRVTRTDLEQARDLPTVRALIADQLDRVERGLGAGSAAIDLVPPASRPMLRCMLSLDALTVAAARADVPALLRRPANCSKLAAVRVLGREYLSARRTRRA
ncbi:squalene/phytoene synthase family protein [Actinospica durhamensis]|uniref:Squalene/phytoene synthase family protein n=1 Tax=Actinospica durhamensis TaxID=1508375 RepID=A0A941IQU0_9ACTN|nr:squalene/phytoene synthase family protein [Actinospica durhamensis]MBR7838065.1 squalene/phytoene synthase family protein [Actinospica durhamensis]